MVVNGVPCIDGGYGFSQVGLLRKAIESLPRVKHIIFLSPKHSGLEKVESLAHHLAYQALTLHRSRGVREVVRARKQQMRYDVTFLLPHLSHDLQPYIHVITPAGPKIGKFETNEARVHEAVKQSAIKVLHMLGHSTEVPDLPRYF